MDGLSRVRFQQPYSTGIVGRFLCNIVLFLSEISRGYNRNYLSVTGRVWLIDDCS